MALLFAAFVFVIMLFSMAIVFGCMILFTHLGIIDYPNSFHQPLYLFAVVSLLVSVFMAVFTSHRPLKPWYVLMNAANEISNGNYSVRVNTKGPEAIQELYCSFNHMAEELGSVEVLRTDFVNNFSHEFKTPIVSIRGFAKMLKRSDLTEIERDEYLDIIISETERLTELSNNVLNLSKIEQQTILSNKKSFNVSEQIRLVIVMMLSKWSKKPVNVTFESDEVYLIGNEELLKQVWINLLDNAIKFSPDNRNVEINIFTEENGIRFNFTDCGNGMTIESTSHIFEKFYQGDISHTVQGNGLGLTISKRIVELHSGTIHVAHSDENGTIIEVYLPQ